MPLKVTEETVATALDPYWYDLSMALVLKELAPDDIHKNAEMAGAFVNDIVDRCDEFEFQAVKRLLVSMSNFMIKSELAREETLDGK